MLTSAGALAPSTFATAFPNLTAKNSGAHPFSSRLNLASSLASSCTLAEKRSSQEMKASRVSARSVLRLILVNIRIFRVLI